MIRQYLVGGAVRDSLLGIKPKDIDYLVTGLSIDDLPHYLEKSGYQKLRSSNSYLIDPVKQTAKALSVKDNAVVDFKVSNSLEEDLGYRDFTINAMAIGVDTNKLVDLFNGQQHLQSGYISFVQSPLEAISSSPERLIRAARFFDQLDSADFSTDVNSSFYDDYFLLLLSSVNVDVLKCQTDKWISSSGSGKVIKFLGTHDKFTKALFTKNLSIKIHPNH